jgi:hypothetical protein
VGGCVTQPYVCGLGFMRITQRVSFFSACIATCFFKQLNRFDIVMAEKSLVVRPREPSNFCRYQFHMEIPMEVSVPNVPGRTKYVSEYYVLKSLYYGDIARE